MGGMLKAPNPRLDAKVYHALVEKLIAILRGAAPHARITPVPAYSGKATFGDLDLVVDFGEGDEAVRQRTAAIEALRPTQTVSRGEVTALAIPAEIAGHPFQVDLIEPGSEWFDFTLHFYAFNDLGNLMARVAALAGLKLGPRGLRYVARNPDNEHHVLDELLVTKDWDETLSVLGYDPAAYHAGAAGGFRTLEDLFLFAVETPLFMASAFFPENLDHATRTRDANRPTYEAFLSWLEHACPPEKLNGSHDWSDRAAAREEFLVHVRERFPAFKAAFEEAAAEHGRELMARRIMGPESISRHAGIRLRGKELREVLREIASRFPSTKARADWIIAATQADRDALVDSALAEVRRRQKAKYEDPQADEPAANAGMR